MGKKIQTANASAFKVGAISLAFLILGYQAALFVHRVSVERAAVLRDHPDTVYVIDSALAIALLREEGLFEKQRRDGGWTAPDNDHGRSADGHDRANGNNSRSSNGRGTENGNNSRSPNGRGTENGKGAASSRSRSKNILGTAEDRDDKTANGGIGAASRRSRSNGTSNQAGNRSNGSTSSGSAASPRSSATDGAITIRRNAAHEDAVRNARSKTRKVESFRFNPNSATVEELQRLGFSEKQALSIENYRAKGGRFRRKADFARSYVVSDSIFRRLEPFIDIPLVDINTADSAAFDALPGIGPWFAARMVTYRNELGGYSCTEQLTEIWHFDREKFDGIADLIFCSPPRDSLRLWKGSADELRRHPHIRNYETARAIVLFRENTPPEDWTVEGLRTAGILSAEKAERLSRCAIGE